MERIENREINVEVHTPSAKFVRDSGFLGHSGDGISSRQVAYIGCGHLPKVDTEALFAPQNPSYAEMRSCVIDQICGLMRELLTLDYLDFLPTHRLYDDLHFIGSDIELEWTTDRKGIVTGWLDYRADGRETNTQADVWEDNDFAFVARKDGSHIELIAHITPRGYVSFYRAFGPLR